MADHTGKTVAEILTEKKASIRAAALPPGSPSWDEILDLTWEELVAGAKRRDIGYKTIKKLLGNKEYDK
jgi:hypothetical protein